MKLYEILQKNHVFKGEELDAYVHALVDINDSLVRVLAIPFSKHLL